MQFREGYNNKVPNMTYFTVLDGTFRVPLKEPGCVCIKYTKMVSRLNG